MSIAHAASPPHAHPSAASLGRSRACSHPSLRCAHAFVLCMRALLPRSALALSASSSIRPEVSLPFTPLRACVWDLACAPPLLRFALAHARVRPRARRRPFSRPSSVWRRGWPPRRSSATDSAAAPSSFCPHAVAPSSSWPSCAAAKNALQPAPFPSSPV